MRTVSLEELAQHGPESEAPWVVVDGEVLEVTSFAELHPGGKQILLHSTGTDASQTFHMVLPSAAVLDSAVQYHHDGVLQKYRQKLKVGELPGGKIVPAPVPFAQPLHFGQFNSPYYKPTHYKFAARVQRFVTEEIMPTMHSWAEDSSPPRELYLKMGREGFLACLTGASDFPREWVDPGTPEPEDYDVFHEFIVIDLISQCGNPSVISGLTNGPAIALTCIMKFGSLAQKQLIATDVLMGRAFIALAMSEPNAGSDVAGLQCRAVEDESGFVINGVKKWITNAAYEAETSSGLSIRKIALGPKSNIAGTSYLEFDDVSVPKAMLIGARDAAFKYLMTNLNHERLYFSTMCNRIARVCVEESYRFALKRKTFGKLLIEHDIIKSLLAKCSARVEQQHAWLESVYFQVKTMSRAEADRNLGFIVCGIKAQCSEVLEECASASTHIFGGNALDARSAGRRVQPLVDAVKGFAVPAGSTKIMEMQMVKLAVKHSATAQSKL